jgi:dihydropteroate synthase
MRVGNNAPVHTPERATTWRLAHGQRLSLEAPLILGILNLTPDSFSDGGEYPTVEAGVSAAARMVEAGAHMLDLGGESTRPGATSVADNEQIARVIPVLEAIRRSGGPARDIPISIDTTRASVALAALNAGADAVNDISAGLDDQGMLGLVAQRGAGMILMHRLRPPARDSYSDQYDSPPEYADVVQDVAAHLGARIWAGVEAGIDPESIAVDPGLGFGKSVEQNLALIARTGELVALGRPIVSAASRKSFVGRISLGGLSDPQARLAGSLAASVAHCLAGASIFRVHDVAEQAEALRIAEAVRRAGRPLET